ncbi:carbonate dehydratase [Methylotuvimicrobium alcaliphilum]|uniref:Carbonic anhydrase n=1 Tax=Methylotuvimicrobium alcaliphilum (strain DSM 19304 / NCIMB 14124 / VKM B-2133 / 20Z) TaxID=1091494 RepID=G4SVP2_META2|nr:carbonate dehydratase [Methylotuvimicrobium alcaliphilum]CCE24101.1 Carbonic anhydrase 2 (Carbonate dehydratase 2) [Methylotuvimicrobium alcaliphilum 20Z]
MKSFEKLLMENKKWASDKQSIDPNFFKHLAKEQKPEFLWIGCSDSRVPAELIVNAEPGEIFIHRNIANQMVATDFNCLSVLQYAVAVLKVKHIIVCGHYNCGGVKAALSKQHPKLVLTNKWLMHIKGIYRLHKDEIDSLPSEEQRINRLVELNILEQVQTLAHTSIIQQAWHQEQRPVIHGWVYGLENGLLNSLATIYPDAEIDPIFKYDYQYA